MLFVKSAYFLDRFPKTKQSSNNRAGAGAKYQVKAFAERAFGYAFDLAKYAEGVETFGAAAVEAQNSAWIFFRKICHSLLPRF